MSGQPKAAYVFPGQGAQAAGMGADICARYPAARAVFDEADHALGFELSKLCFNGPDEELTRTVNVQPAILTVSIAYLKAAQTAAGVQLPLPDLVAGHSLGQYTALVVANVLTLSDAVRLVRERGRLMYDAGQAQAGAMAAVIGADETVLDEICRVSGMQISNRNSPGQVVVSGAAAKFDEFKRLAEAHGIRRVIPLKVSGAFHSELMRPAVDGLKKAVSQCDFRQPAVPVISNVTARVLPDAEAIRKDLVEQLTNCVQWQSSVENMTAMGTGVFYEIGPGQVLSGLIKRINPDVSIYHVSDLLKAGA